jgi:hypothetical protein
MYFKGEWYFIHSLILKTYRLDGGRVCPDLPLPEDGNPHIIHLNGNHLALVGIVYYKRLLLSAQWNAQRVKEMDPVVVQLVNIVTLIRPDHVFGIKSTNELLRWAGKRCF